MRRVLVLLSLVVAAGGCEDLPVNNPIGGPDTPADDGPGTLIIVDEGNLADAVADTEEARADGFARLLVNDRDQFGAGDLDPEQLQFEVHHPEQIFGLNGERLASTTLVQTVQGAQVLESLQYGAWVVGDDGRGGELRRLRAQLRDPADLPPAPPLLSRADVAMANTLFATWLRERGIVDGDRTVPGTAAISERLGTSGYLARWTRSEPEGGLSKIVAILDPELVEVTVYVDQPACHAGQGVSR